MRDTDGAPEVSPVVALLDERNLITPGWIHL